MAGLTFAFTLALRHEAAVKAEFAQKWAVGMTQLAQEAVGQAVKWSPKAVIAGGTNARSVGFRLVRGGMDAEMFTASGYGGFLEIMHRTHKIGRSPYLVPARDTAVKQHAPRIMKGII